MYFVGKLSVQGEWVLLGSHLGGFKQPVPPPQYWQMLENVNTFYAP